MSIVKNEAKYKNGLLRAIREQLEHRALWLYLLCDEAKKRGLDPRDFGSDAIKRCGLSQGANLVKKGGTDSLKGLKKTLFTKPAQLVFEMDVLESTDDKLSIDFHYCPLVKAWQKAGCTGRKWTSHGRLPYVRYEDGGFTVKLHLVRHGMNGDDVKALQGMLIARGCGCGKSGADGLFGDNTLKAVKAFQELEELQVDGIAGPKTFAALLGVKE